MDLKAMLITSEAIDAIKKTTLKFTAKDKTERVVPPHLIDGLCKGMVMRLAANQLADEASRMKDEADSLVMATMIVAQIKTVTNPGTAIFTYTEGKKGSPTYPMKDFIAELTKRGVPVAVIAEAKKACEKPPKKEKGDPSLTVTSWESHLKKMKGGSKQSNNEEEEGE